MKRYIRKSYLKDLNENPEFHQLKQEIIDASKDAVKLRIAKYKLRRLKKLTKRKYRIEQKIPVKKKIRKNSIEYKAIMLEADLPKSEVWFREMYLKEDFQRQFSEDLFKDKFNYPFNRKYIPDIVNMGYKYVIEIDGSIHNKPEQILKDKIKDHYFNKRGYIVIRVRHWNMDDYKSCIERVKARIAEIEPLEVERRNVASKRTS